MRCVCWIRAAGHVWAVPVDVRAGRAEQPLARITAGRAVGGDEDSDEDHGRPGLSARQLSQQGVYPEPARARMAATEASLAKEGSLAAAISLAWQWKPRKRRSDVGLRLWAGCRNDCCCYCCIIGN